MKRLVVLIFTFLFTKNIYGQTAPSEYYVFIKKADSLYRIKDYKGSAFKYSDAFKTLGWKGKSNDRYNAACSWALAGYPDSAFFNLERLAFKVFYSDYNRVTRDKDLTSLYENQRWKPLLEKIKHNKDSVEAKMDKKLIAKLDSLEKEDQKWRNLWRMYRNKEISKDSIGLKTILMNSALTDKNNSIEVKRIFYKYGFPNYDLVGFRASTSFFLLVQHSDNDPKFQDSVLKAMAIEAEKGKASWSDYAYLTDRVKLNTGEKQIYGTQMQLNSDGTSYEPQSVIDPGKLNERRKSAGLDPIEEYIEEMNRSNFGTLKKK